MSNWFSKWTAVNYHEFRCCNFVYCRWVVCLLTTVLNEIVYCIRCPFCVCFFGTEPHKNDDITMRYSVKLPARLNILSRLLEIIGYLRLNRIITSIFSSNFTLVRTDIRLFKVKFRFSIQDWFTHLLNFPHCARLPEFCPNHPTSPFLLSSYSSSLLQNTEIFVKNSS